MPRCASPHPEPALLGWRQAHGRPPSLGLPHGLLTHPPLPAGLLDLQNRARTRPVGTDAQGGQCHTCPRSPHLPLNQEVNLHFHRKGGPKVTLTLVLVMLFANTR